MRQARSPCEAGGPAPRVGTSGMLPRYRNVESGGYKSLRRSRIRFDCQFNIALSICHVKTSRRKDAFYGMPDGSCNSVRAIGAIKGVSLIITWPSFFGQTKDRKPPSVRGSLTAFVPIPTEDGRDFIPIDSENRCGIYSRRGDGNEADRHVRDRACRHGLYHPATDRPVE